MKRQNIYFLILPFVLASCNLSNVPTSTADLRQQETETQTKRKIIYTASMLMAVDEPDSTVKHVLKIVKAEKGFLFSRNGLQLTFRVPPSKLEDIMQGVSILGDVKERNVNSVDVTDQFYDDRIRLENARATHARYLALLERANTVDEVLKVERELERISREIDLIQGRLNRLTDRTALATLTVSLKQRTRPGVFGHIGVGLYKGTKWLFVKD